MAVDPLTFVTEAFPWGVGALAEHAGPDAWQVDILSHVRDGLPIAHAVQIAIASGHGVGKSALVAWLVLWAITTAEDAKGVVTANTESQLRTKTWPELAKWHRLCAFGKDFTLTATSLYSADADHEKTWRVDAIPWSERNTEAFAGLHNQGKRILVMFDEASAIPDIIWETTEGALTDEETQIIWAAFGNPTRNTGRFRECFGRLRHRWQHRQIDSRTARMTNKAQIAQWVADYGEDSDFVRVRVRGVFPRAGSTQLIPSDVVDASRARWENVHTMSFDPLVLGVDVARFGDDSSIILARRGRHVEWIEPHRGLDTMQLAARVARKIEQHNPDAVFIDEGSMGAGVVDRLRQLNHDVIGVAFGAGATAPVGGEKVANKRAEMWCLMRDWLKTGGAIPDDNDLAADLTGVEYGYNADDEILLEKKADMKKRGLASPDRADALALTFAMPVGARKVAPQGKMSYRSSAKQTKAPWE